MKTEKLKQENTAYVMPEDVALAELKALLEYHLDEKFDIYEVQADYPQVLKALREGLLVITEDKTPVYTLKNPVQNVGGSVDVLTEVKFKTRITLQEKRDLERGVDITKQKIYFGHKGIAFMIGQLVGMLDRIQVASPFDFKVIDQLAGAFFN